MKLDSLLAAIDNQKAFGFVSHSFLISALGRYGFGNRLVKWMKILLKNQGSCVINGGNTIKYFKLKKGLVQGDQYLLTYLF